MQLPSGVSIPTLVAYSPWDGLLMDGASVCRRESGQVSMRVKTWGCTCVSAQARVYPHYPRVGGQQEIASFTSAAQLFSRRFWKQRLAGLPPRFDSLSYAPNCTLKFPQYPHKSVSKEVKVELLPTIWLEVLTRRIPEDTHATDERPLCTILDSLYLL